MATPSSSATSSASPPLSYLQATTTAVLPGTAGTSTDSAEQEERKKAVQKFMARAEISMVTRGLRARLSYASYKATNNIPHIPLRDLEAQSQSSTSRIIGAKRKASSNVNVGGSNNYYNNPATQGVHNPTNNSSAANARKGSMAPPALSASASRTYYPAPAVGRSSNAPPSLYSSILAPPPAKQARTIHNPRDPPIAAPTRPPTAAARTRRGSKASEQPPAAVPSGRPRALSLAEGTRSHAKNRRDDPVDNNKRKDKHGAKGKHKGRGSSSMDLTHDGVDVDMKAAAALTSLLLHSRPSMTASTTSPRSSVSAGSDSGSVQSFSQFAQSSARTTTTVPSAESSFALRNTTPPPLSGTSMSSVLSDVGGTPRANPPSDSEAADLMLFLATSPSPVRPTTKDTKDGPAYRALGGGPGLRAKGRVLFAGAGAGSDDGRPLMSEGSFGSSNGGDVCMSDGELPLRGFESRLSISSAHDGGGGGLCAPMDPSVIPPTPIAPTPAQLLDNSWPSSSSYGHADSETTPRPQAPPTPGSLSFNLNDFINVSPSPAAPMHSNGGSYKHGLGSSLRSDVGRKLFGEEQGRHQGGEQVRSGGLGAGIDLVK